MDREIRAGGDARGRADGPAVTRRGLLGVAAATAASSAGCLVYRLEEETDTVRRSFDPGEVDRLRVDEAPDAVTIEAADEGGAVSVRADRRARGETDLADVELVTAVEDGVLRVSASVARVTGIGGGSVDVSIAVPPSVAVGRVASTDGPVTLSTVGGSPAVSAGDGDVVARDVSGDLSVAAGDGDVTVERTGGVVGVDAGDGDVSVREPGRVGTITAGDGDVDVDVADVVDEATVRAGDGDVTARLAASLDARVLVAAGGRVSGASVLDATTQVTETNVVGRVGDGSRQLRIEAADGDVRLEPL